MHVSPKGEYKPDPGQISVRAKRDAKVDCIWEGKLAAEEEHTVMCKM